MVPNESDSLSLTKEKVLARIDVAMGGHVAEELFIGRENVTTGCGSDLKSATELAYMAVRQFGMFGEDAGYISADKRSLS
jgi:ATP-dependent metalloprotease